MNYLKKKKGAYLRAYFGGGSSVPSAPSYTAPSLNESEADRTKRYDEALPAFENLFNATPGQYGEYLKGVAAAYPEQQQRAAQISTDIYNMLPQVNSLSPEFQAQAQKDYDIRKERGLQTLNDLYSPLEQKITGRAFQNFGGMESSAYRDLQGRLGQERGQATSDYVNQMELQRQQEEAQQLSLQQQDMQNLMSAAQMYNLQAQEYPSAIGQAAQLGGGGTQEYNQLINDMESLAIQRAQLQNQFNMGNYSNQLAQYQAQQNYVSPLQRMLGLGVSALGSIGGMF